jgi:transcriptional regulator with XRE-family HTH domain
MIKETDKVALKKFGNNLRRLRKEKGLTLRELSSSCSIDYSNILKMEQGKINITFTSIIDLASALEIKPAVLFEYDRD